MSAMARAARLTEAVRRKPYSVVLLDEVEKAHPDVHELFFQVFDKGQMEDGTGRRIDFKNTLIILTSNVGTDEIMQHGRARRRAEPDPEEPGRGAAAGAAQGVPAGADRPPGDDPVLPALAGRCSAASCGSSSAASASAWRDNHNAAFTYDDAVVEHIVARCNGPDRAAA